MQIVINCPGLMHLSYRMLQDGVSDPQHSHQPGLLSNAARKLISFAFNISMRGPTFDNLRKCGVQYVDDCIVLYCAVYVLILQGVLHNSWAPVLSLVSYRQTLASLEQILSQSNLCLLMKFVEWALEVFIHFRTVMYCSYALLHTALELLGSVRLH